ncbi:phosphoribosyl-ATP pyrophosphohydrolase [Burkholderia thailandensis E264]|nr:phosphoribosyl-ATP pyrophosphohydrolase [Burkholderia thailandensis E264]
MVQGRGVGPCAARARSAPRLRRGRRAAEGRAGRRHRVPHGPALVLFPEIRGHRRRRRMGRGRSGAQRSRTYLQMTQPTIEDTLLRLAAVIDSRKGGDPEQSYVSRLFHKGDDAVLKKIGEEATEVVLAAKDVRQGGAPSALVGEVADLWFHCLVALSHFDLSPADVIAELERREGMSGIEEKALRKRREREENGG